MQAESGSHVVWMCLADEDDDDEDYTVCAFGSFTPCHMDGQRCTISIEETFASSRKPSVFAILYHTVVIIYASLINRFCG